MKIKEISEKIKETIEPLMRKWEDGFFAWVKEMQQYCKHDVYKEVEKESGERMSSYCDRVDSLKRKKGWNLSLEKFFSRSEDDLKKMIHKEANKKLDKIDVAVVKKLKNVEVKTVENMYFNMNGADCYAEGGWAINKEKVFSFRTIYAGGYNIQCLHIRTLYSYK